MFLFVVQWYQIARGRVALFFRVAGTMDELNDFEKAWASIGALVWPFTGLADFRITHRMAWWHMNASVKLQMKFNIWSHRNDRSVAFKFQFNWNSIIIRRQHILDLWPAKTCTTNYVHLIGDACASFWFFFLFIFRRVLFSVLEWHRQQWPETRNRIFISFSNGRAE